MTLDWLKVAWFDRSGLGDDLPAVHYNFNSPYIKFISFSCLTPNGFEIAKLV
jgi:hypothetical protein